jgi:hypothetical protein
MATADKQPNVGKTLVVARLFQRSPPGRSQGDRHFETSAGHRITARTLL